MPLTQPILWYQTCCVFFFVRDSADLILLLRSRIKRWYFQSNSVFQNRGCPPVRAMMLKFISVGSMAIIFLHTTAESWRGTTFFIGIYYNHNNNSDFLYTLISVTEWRSRRNNIQYLPAMYCEALFLKNDTNSLRGAVRKYAANQTRNTEVNPFSFQ